MFKASLIEKNAVNSQNELIKYITAYYDEAIKNNEHLHILPGKVSKTHPSRKTRHIHQGKQQAAKEHRY